MWWWSDSLVSLLDQVLRRLTLLLVSFDNACILHLVMEYLEVLWVRWLATSFFDALYQKVKEVFAFLWV